MWILWLIAAAALGAAEFFTLTLALGILAAAALVAGVVGAVGLPLVFQVLAFAATAGFGLLVVRPIARQHLRQPPPIRDGTQALVGKEAIVLEEVTGLGGRIKLSGEEWTARTLDRTQVIPAGSWVDVMEIEGATALVYPQEMLP